MSTKSILFIDSRVFNYQSFIDGLTEPTEVFVFDGASDGLSQMASYLYGRTGIDAIHVISHGSLGTLYLGSTVLDGGNLANYQSQLASIGSALSETGDILLYGCNVAQGDVGVQFIGNLARATWADVAASSNATGTESLGGDWVLESTTGSVEADKLPADRLAGLLAVNTAPTFSLRTGKLTTDIGADDTGNGVALQVDGKIVVVGNSFSSANTTMTIVLARYNLDGSLDKSFGGDGTISTNVNGWDWGRSVTIQPDAKIIVAGYSDGFTLIRYNTDGSLDTTFDGDGKLVTPVGSGAFGVTVQADGKIIAVGDAPDQRSNNFGLVRYNADGSLDVSFDNDGIQVTDFGSSEWARSVGVQDDGKIVVAGRSHTGAKFALARYNADGSLDTSFDGDGQLTTDFGSGSCEGQSITLQPDGKILVAGYSSGDFALARYNADGSLDTSFDGDGKLTTDFGSSDGGSSVTLQEDGKIVVAGTSSGDFALARYNADGSLDTSFGPVVNTLSNTPAFTEPTHGTTAVTLDPVVQISDTELAITGNYDGASLTLSRHTNASVQDVFSAGSGSLTALSTGSYFAVDDVTIGRVIANSAGTLTLAFNANATQSLVNKAMQQIAYANTSDAPPATVQIDWTFNDGNTGTQGTGGAMSVTGSTTVQITAVNDPPILSVPLVDQTSRVGTNFAFTIPVGSFTDPDIEVLKYSVRMADGTAVPPWLTFNAATKTFSGTPSAFDVGVIDIQVTAKDAADASSGDVFRLTVIPANSLPTGSINITGSVSQGQTLTASSTLADSDGLGTFSYQWKAAGTNITGATASTFTLTEAEVGKTVTVTVSYTDGYGTTETSTSGATSAVANFNDQPTGTVTITGTVAQGQTITANNTLADVDGLGTISYQWNANGSAIDGATTDTLSLTEEQVGKAITVTASFTDGHSTLEAVTSTSTALVANVNDLPIGAVSIAGAATQGQTLSASNSLSDADGIPVSGTGAISYQWKAAGLDILGATSRTLVLGEAQVGKDISVTASYTDFHGTAQAVTSSATAAIANVNDLPTGAVTIIGTAAQGKTLAATNNLADVDGMGPISYQWMAGGNLISSSTGNTLLINQPLVGKSFSVVAKYTDGHGALESVTSDVMPYLVNTAPTFMSRGGQVTTDFGPTDYDFDISDSIIVQSDGKLVAAGTGNGQLALARYNTDGLLDSSFGISGRVVTTIGSLGDASITLQSEGKFVIAGATYNGINRDFVLARFSSNGVLDTSFGISGKLTTDFGSNDYGNCITTQSDGKLLVAGTSNQNFALARYNIDGSLDTSFGTGGKVTTDIGSADSANSVEVQVDGKVVVAGQSYDGIGYDFALVRYNTDGSLDTSFGTEGIATTDFGMADLGNSVRLQVDGKIVVAGSSFDPSVTDFALARYNADGSLDASFGVGGKVTTDFGYRDYCNSVALQSDGKIVVAGFSFIPSNSIVALARYNIDGSLDASFGFDGKVAADFGAASRVNSLVIQSDGKIVVSGSGAVGSDSSDFALVRFDVNGKLDLSFSARDNRNTLDGNPAYTGQIPEPFANTAVVLDTDVTVFDQELSSGGSYSGATLTLARHGGANPSDVFSSYSGALSVLRTGSYISVGEVTIGMVINNSNGLLKLGFNSNATQGFVSQAMHQIAYDNTANNPPVSAQIDWTFNDGNTGAQGLGGALSVTGSTVVKITARNAAPVVAHELADVRIFADQAFSYVLPTDAFSDPNEGTALSYRFSVDNGASLPSWVNLRFDPITRTISGELGVIRLYEKDMFDITVTASDSLGAKVSDVFRLSVIPQSSAGTASSDTFICGDGNDTIDGSAGVDMSIFHGNLSGYTLTKVGSSYTVRSNAGLDSSTDTVTNVEALKFADKTVNLTIQAKAAAAPQTDVQNLAELYVAFFNRVPDADGLSYWIDQKAGGLSLNQIADSFYAAGLVYSDQTGFTTDMTDADFVRLVYKNVLGRTGETAPPKEDVDYWAGNLHSGADTRGSLINTILVAAHTFKNDPLWHQVPDLLDNKIAVAQTFAIDWGLNYNTPQDSITQGMAIAAAITPTGTQDAIALIGVSGAEMHLV
jgi:uncharacterized delta-60 repeat protein